MNSGMPRNRKGNMPHIMQEKLYVFLCDHCDLVHLVATDKDDDAIGQVLISQDDLNSVIIELMKIRDQALAK